MLTADAPLFHEVRHLNFLSIANATDYFLKDEIFSEGNARILKLSDVWSNIPLEMCWNSEGLFAITIFKNLRLETYSTRSLTCLNYIFLLLCK